ncbi:MAG: hypothetical protein JWR36_3047 [Glaciihabitans sp.]|nr:hypothetical protein [Glaciihabitans sp.]
MEFSGLGGGIMVVLAAGLWLVYLMPTWFKRREFVASERTEVRRQQALRILQETAPQQVQQPVIQRVEAIVSPTGEVTDHARLAEAIERSRKAQAARVTTRQLTEQASPPAQAASTRARVARRLRRTRALASILLFAAAIAIVVQITLMATTGIVVAAWGVLGFSAVVGVVSVAALGRLAAMARRRAALPAVRVSQPLRELMDAPEPEVAAPVITSWTPVPIPKPQYLTRSEVAPVEVSDPVEELRTAAAESDRVLREAQTSPEVTPIVAPEPAPASSPSRWASMGVVESLDTESTDLDDILRRRRATA